MGLYVAFSFSLLASLQPVEAFTLRNPPLPARGAASGEPEGEGQGRGSGRRAQTPSQVDRQLLRPHPPATNTGDSDRQLPSSPSPASSSSSGGSPRALAWSVQGQAQEVQGKGAASPLAPHSHASAGAGKTHTETGRQADQVSAGARGQQPAGDVYKFSPGDSFAAQGRAVAVTSLVEVAAAEKEDREKKEFQGVDLSSQPQALLQEVHQSDLPQHQGASMAVGVLLGVAALCGLVMAALFQCCCRKKRSQGQDQGQEQDGVKAGQGSLPHTRTPSPQPDPQTEKLAVPPDEEDRESESHRLLDEDLGDFSAVQRETEILKSFRKPPPPKNRGKATRAARQKQEPAPAKDDFFPSLPDTQAPEAAKEFKDSSLAAVDVSAKRASMELLLADALSKDKGREEGKGDKDKDRGDDKSKEEEKEEEEKEEEEEENLLQEPPPPPARRKTPTRETTTPPRGERTPPRREMTPKLEEPTASASTDRPSSFVEGFANGGNIFMQIDPTVKRSLDKAKNGSKIPVTRRSTASPTESPVASPLIKPDRRSPDRRSPQTPADSPPLVQPPAPSPSLRPGSHRKFLVPSVHGEQMDELLKSLKTRLQEDSTVDSSSLSGQSKPQQEDTTDDGEAKGRDRSYSDSSKPKRVVKQTDL